MKRHWQYLSYVLRHKWFVLKAGLKTGAPLWSLIIHDWSKFLPQEWCGYVDNFYGKEGQDQRGVAERFEVAWNAHQKRNKHHWQYWVMFNDRPARGALTRYSILPMPDRYVREMVADWMGAGRAITGKWEVGQWYAKNRHNILLHSRTRLYVEQLIQGVTGRDIPLGPPTQRAYRDQAPKPNKPIRQIKETT